VGLVDVLTDGMLVERSEVRTWGWGSTGRGERMVNTEGVSRREEMRADMDDPLLGSVEVGVDGSEIS
jgi:hypothetical protein